jgi:hypothetical protein
VDIWIDGVKVNDEPVYLFSENLTRRVVIWETHDLAPGEHVLEVRPTGRKYGDSTGYRVDVDAFIVLNAP